MKLCYIANANSIHTARWITPFIEAGHEIHLLSYQTIMRRWEGLKAEIDLTRLGNIPKLRFLYWGLWVRQYVQRLHPDILHAHQIQGAGWLGAMTAYHPFVVSAWGSDILVEPHKSPFRQQLVQYVLRQADRLTVPSTLMYRAAEAQNFPSSRLRLIPWGLDLQVFHPQPNDRLETRQDYGIAPATPVIFSPRGITPLYNLDIVLSAVRALVERLPCLRLVMLRYNVDMDYLAKIKREIAAYALKNVVLWLPPQPSPVHMARLYRMADTAISIPSSEGYGFSVYEALACGCPAVITDLPLFADDLEHQVHVLKVAVGDVQQTAQSLLAMLTDAQLHQQLHVNGLARCHKMSIAHRIEMSQALYQELLEYA